MCKGVRNEGAHGGNLTTLLYLCGGEEEKNEIVERESREESLEGTKSARKKKDEQKETS